MKFKEWLILESADQVVLMKTVNDEGSESIKKGGFQLQDTHRSTANYYKKYGDTDTGQMYGPGLYFTIVPAGQDPTEYAKKNCKMYSQWGNHIVFATIKPGSRGLVTGFPPNHPMWKLIASKNTYVYDQLEALGLDKIVGYTKNNVHVDKEWGYKLHDKMDFWAHSHWAEGGEARLNVVVYNPSVLQPAGEFECETGKKNPEGGSSSSTIPNDKINASQTSGTQGEKSPEAPKSGSWRLTPQPEGQAPPGKVWNKILGRWIDAPDAQRDAHPPIQRRSWVPPPGTDDLEL
jgi:hypothetical protein